MIINESEILTTRGLVEMANLHTKAGERALKGRDNPTIVLHFGLAARFGEEAFDRVRAGEETTRNLLAVSTAINYSNAGWHREIFRSAQHFMDSLGGQIFPRVETMLQDLAESAEIELSAS